MDSMKMYFGNQSFTIAIPHVLFKNWSVNSDDTFSYVASTFFAFAIAFLSQLAQFLLYELDDEWIRQQKSTGKRWLGKILQSIVYMFYISISFVTMLLLMTYDFGLFMALVFGNVLGYSLFIMFIQEFLIRGKGLRLIQMHYE